MTEITADELAKVNSFPKLVALLRDKLEWPINEQYDFEDVIFEYEPHELGLKAEEAAKLREIHQLRPLVTGQPWGIFFLSFDDKNMSVTVLRRILRALVVKQRASGQSADRAAWMMEDLIFAANFGKSGERELAFVHFSDGASTGDLPVMKVLGWNHRDTTLHNRHAASLLSQRMAWPDDQADQEGWRGQWSSAFEVGHREVISTSQELAKRLAALAGDIRARANELLDAEIDDGPMRTMLEAFRKNLIHDLDEDGFADMFAQTICYGMLAARISRPMGIIADNLADMVPRTNPFLKELFASFLHLGGRDKRQGMDFDELGVRDVVDMLNRANMEAVLRDFGDKNPKEDPVIHFYELFLKEYDPQKRMQRGVFYTPRPVVNFIVRGVDEILRTEFGLPLGLADTSTWAELAARNDKIAVPDHVDPDAPFVQILDPATGTGTFLVEVIDLIHKRMVATWGAEGKSKEQIKAAWNEYVPAHLLPRLTAFELMMAPYAIAHMKVGLKLVETGYTFGSDERARIFLTNALEPAQDLDLEFTFMSEALAHEALAASLAKSKCAFTAIIGNPPYATLSSNSGAFIRGLMKDYKASLGNEIQIQALSNDYAKFMRLSEYFRENANFGVVGLITDNSYLDGILFVDLRERLIFSKNRATIFDLGGNNRRLGGNILDEGVFDIRQGTSVLFSAVGTISLQIRPQLVVIEGSRDHKYELLSKLTLTTCSSVDYKEPGAEFNLGQFSGNAGESSVSLTDIFSAGKRGVRKLAFFGACIATRHDDFAISFTIREQEDKLRDFIESDEDEKVLRDRYGLCTTAHFSFKLARKVTLNEARSSIARVLYRPFDWRFMAYHERLVGEFRNDIFRNIDEQHIALLTTRRVTGGGFTHSLVADGLSEYKSGTHDRNTQIFPLYIKGIGRQLSNELTRPNINREYALNFAVVLNLTYEDGIARGKQESLGTDFIKPKAEQIGLLDTPWDGRGDLAKTLGPRDLFDYIYAVLHAPSYRSRYAEFLKSAFPRIPTPGTRALFAALVPLGRELVALHLLKADEAEILKNPEDIRFAGTGEARVEKGYPQYANGKVMINTHRWFEDVPAATWEFHVGGYQPCEKWLKDRAAKGGKKQSDGRVLTDEDILHYRRMVTALTETRRIMAEIDMVIESYGGWPGAFAVANGK